MDPKRDGYELFVSGNRLGVDYENPTCRSCARLLPLLRLLTGAGRHRRCVAVNHTSEADAVVRKGQEPQVDGEEYLVSVSGRTAPGWLACHQD